MFQCSPSNRDESQGPSLPALHEEDRISVSRVWESITETIEHVFRASADLCLELRSKATAASHRGLHADDAAPPDSSGPAELDAFPLGENPFPPQHPAKLAFQEATWKAKTKISEFKSEFLRKPGTTPTEFLAASLTYRRRWFSVCAHEATLVVGDEETAQWYERWIDATAAFLIVDTMASLRSRDEKANPDDGPYFASQQLESFERELTLELIRMVVHYKGVAASKVQSVIELRRTQQAATASALDGAYTRRKSRNPPEATRQEDQLRDARHYAATHLNLEVSGLQLPPNASDADVEAAHRRIRQRIVLRAWEDFVPRHRHFSDFQLGYEEFEAALWTEGFPSPGFPSLEDFARQTIQGPVAAKGTSSGAEDSTASSTHKVKPEQSVRAQMHGLDAAVGNNAVDRSSSIDQFLSRCNLKTEQAPPPWQPGTGSRTDRQQTVDGYISEVLRIAKKRLTRADLWKSQHYKTRTEFERWESYWYERRQKRPNQAAHERFTRMLREKPHLK